MQLVEHYGQCHGMKITTLLFTAKHLNVEREAGCQEN
jgi:hypothetical protein